MALLDPPPLSPSPHDNDPQTLIIAVPKSVTIAFFLTFFFGPLGMLYSTVKGALIMMIISCVFGLLTAGISLIITWPICMIWGCRAAAKPMAQKVRVMRE